MAFEKEIKFVTKTLQNDDKGEAQFVEVSKSIKASFKELDRADRSQRALCWYIMGLIKGKSLKDGTFKLPEDVLCDITDKYIEEMMLADTNELKQDKQDFLNDNIAVVQFGTWLVYEKIMPFFLMLLSS